MDKIINTIAEELNIKPKQVEATITLIDEGNTIPFIARYRKEVTGGLSDEILRDLGERLNYLRNLEQRKEEVVKSIDEKAFLVINTPSRFSVYAPLEIIISAVRQQKNIVSTIGVMQAMAPSLTGSLVLATACAIDVVPNPASFENPALLIPITSVPINPDTIDSIANASLNIIKKDDGIFL